MQKSGYRTDIDGIRALAVLLVVIFHINENLIPGGFVGVDVFFVISGYLITGNILRDYQRGTFTFSEFYRRRIRRILPAMFTVTFVTLIAGTLLLLPEDVNQLALSSLATALSGANIFFTYFLDTSYFAADSATIPLLHMWSLGVEEQFYFLWPVFLIFLLGRARWLLTALASLIVASLAFGEWQLRHEQFEWAYYMLPSRAFQLAAGGTLVFMPQISRLAAMLLAPSGLLLVFGSAFLLAGSSPFPGLNAVPVTIGAAAILASGVHTTPFSTALSVRPLRFVGLISYSLYLWHWPVLAFLRYFYGELDALQQVIAFIVMTSLAVASYFLVELPFRHAAFSFRKSFIRFAVMPTATLALIVVGLVTTDGYGPYRYTDYPKRLANLPEARAAFSIAQTCQRSAIRVTDTEGDGCVIGVGEPRVLLYGDSNATHYIGVIAALAREAGVPFRNYAHSGCVPLNSDPSPYVTGRYLQPCVDSQQVVASDLMQYDLIFLAAAWGVYDKRATRSGGDLAGDLKAFVTALTANGTQVVLIDTVPAQPHVDGRCGRKMLKINALDCTRLGGLNTIPDFISDLKTIAKEIPNTSFLSLRSSICDDRTCPAFHEDGTALYFDRSHLSAEGSRKIGERFVGSSEGLKMVDFIKSTVSY
ncbi:acyltransferase family protein [Nitratireductor sp. GZWM139]|uniref:acyltransferase family protein n=1 Tax=Nitratireductor sp. GZWM139 TaxID=2950541 RepID=UPI0024BE06D0|nr:acyltransferase family protein [Nitratireductor sp. GZWM139]MDJ1463322.1 acyltransferase [Nitratireductor sp. GZWM139]